MPRRWKNSLLAVAMATSPLPQLGPSSTPQDILRCERQLIYRKKQLPCDSAIAADGEGLRMLVSSTPESLEALNRYQENRKSMVSTSYFGMAGILMAAFGPRLASNPSERTLWIGGGIALTLGSYAYGRTRLRANEAVLDQVVDTFNRAHPDDPITLIRAK